MINLIKNELFKIFKKKGIWIILIILFMYTLFINFINKKVDIENSNYHDNYIEILKEDLKNIDIEKDVYLYVDLLNQIENYEFLNTYDKNSWQYYIADNEAYDYISTINTIKYIDKDTKKLEQANNEFDSFKEKLNGNWQDYAMEDMKHLEEFLDYKEMNEYKELELRIKYNIPYGKNKLNEALTNYVMSYNNIQKVQTKRMTYEEKINHETNEKLYYTSKYIIEHNYNEVKDISARGMLLNIFTNCDLFIIIAICLIASSIISEEFNKGTIKMLLTRPYTRTKILLSKFITMILFILFMIFATYFIQFIVGLIFFGPKSLNCGVIVYNYVTHTVKEISLFKNIIITILVRLPMYIILGTFAFCFSTFVNNTGVSMAISIAFYIASDIINSAVYYFNIKWLKYFVTLNWNLSDYLYNKTPILKGTSLNFSILICFIYFTLMIIPTFIYFKRKNIKNI